MKQTILLFGLLLIASCSSSRDDKEDVVVVEKKFPTELLGNWKVESYHIFTNSGESGYSGSNDKGFYLKFDVNNISWKDGNSEFLNRSFYYSGGWEDPIRSNILLSVENGDSSVDIKKVINNQGLREVTIKHKRKDYNTYVFYIKK